MIYDWYKIFNETDFLATGLQSRSYQIYLDGVGLKTVLVTVGNTTGVLIDDVFLSVNMNDRNPFTISNRAVYIDEAFDVWVGIPHES